MTSNTKTILAGGALALAFLGGIAIAPSFVSPAAAQFVSDAARAFAGGGFGGGIGGPSVVATAATYIGITEAALRTELQTGKSLAEVAVANGKTRDGLIAALTTAAGTQFGTLVDQKGAPGLVGRGPHGPAVTGDVHAAAAAYLGITALDLRTRLMGGQTLAAIANATAGKSRDGLIKALVASATARIDAAQTAGTITAAQASTLKATLVEKMTQTADATRPMFGPRGPRGRR